MKPNYDKLYRFSENFAPFAGAFRAGPINEINDANLLFCGQVRPKMALRLGWRQGKRIRDVIWTTFPPLVLVSRAFCQLLRKEGFTGWSTYPVSVYDNEGKLVRGCDGFSITGRAGTIDNTRSKKVWRGPAAQGAPRFQCYVGIFFRHDDWDGTDVFIPAETSFSVVTERVKVALEESELDIGNVEFHKLSTVERKVFRADS